MLHLNNLFRYFQGETTLIICPQCGFEEFHPEILSGAYKINECSCCGYETVTRGTLVPNDYTIDNTKAIEIGYNLTIGQLEILKKRGMPEDIAKKCIDLYNRLSLDKAEDYAAINRLLTLYHVERNE